MKKTLLLITIMSFVITQIEYAFGQRYIENIFSEVNIETDVVYGNNVSIFPTILGLSPATQDLVMDVYTPEGDDATNRPAVILLHTGSFMPAVANGQATGNKNDRSIVEQCMQFAKKGYVAVAINYRLGWNPTSDDENVRRSTLIQAAYRALQDTRTAVRFLRQSVDNGNPYGLSCKIAVGGLGTGGYISMAAATLNDYDTELTLPKFIDVTQDVDGDGELDAVPYIIPEYFGDLNGTSVGILPVLDLDGDGTPEGTDVTLCVPNHIGYDSSVDMVFNIGGALPDSSWIDQGESPMASMHCYLDEFGPYGIGDIIVPVTNEFVVEAHGSFIVQRRCEYLGNNDVFAGLSMEVTDSWYGNGDGAANSALQVQALTDFGQPATDDQGNPIWDFEGHDVYSGLFPIVAPRGDELTSDDCDGCGSGASLCLMPWEQQGSPWDWWNNDVDDPMGYPQLAINSPTAPDGLTASVAACAATLDNPDMSEEKGLAFASMIQEFMAPRIHAALDLGSDAATCDIKEDKLTKELIDVIDITGRKINPNSNNISFHIYNDGSIEKKYLVK